MYTLTLQCPGVPTIDVLETAIEAVVLANVEYFQAEWAAGRDPPCCLECAEIRYVPDDPSDQSILVGAPQVLRDGSASCQAAAAYIAARERAVAMEKGMPYERAKQSHRVRLERRDHPKATDGYWHAYYQSPDGLVDVTEDMKR